MNRPKKITFVLLGIAASVGYASLIVSPWRQEPEVAQDGVIAWIYTQNHIYCHCLKCGQEWEVPLSITQASLKHQHLPPTPAPEKPLKEAYRRVKCDKCGQEYDTLGGCEHFPTQEEIKHFHLSSKGETLLIELSKKKYRGEP